MIRKDITYTDYNGITRTESFYFNLSAAEIAEVQAVGINGMSFSEHLERVGNSQDSKEIYSTFTDILRMSYGVKSDDGRRFIKSPELFEEFRQSEAFSELIVEFFSNPTAAADFANQLIPQAAIDKLTKAQNQPAQPQDYRPSARLSESNYIPQNLPPQPGQAAPFPGDVPTQPQVEDFSRPPHEQNQFPNPHQG